MSHLRFRDWLVKELVSSLGPDATSPMDQMGIIKNGAFPTYSAPTKMATNLKRNKPIRNASTVRLMSKPTP